jgi:hypothetical protein
MAMPARMSTRRSQEHTMPVTPSQALEIKSRFEGHVLTLPGVTGVDLGQRPDGGPTIRVYVAARAAAPALPDQVEGVPVEIIERRFGLQRE